MLTVSDLHLRYGKVNALRGVSLRVERGEIVALIGANGAGKTTTLKTISGLIRPFAGQIRFDGVDITRAAPRDILDAGIAHCPEGRRIFPHLSVRDNLELGAFLRKDHAEVAVDMERLFGRLPDPRRARRARLPGRSRAASSRCWRSAGR